MSIRFSAPQNLIMSNQIITDLMRLNTLYEFIQSRNIDYQFATTRSWGSRRRKLSTSNELATKHKALLKI